MSSNKFMCGVVARILTLVRAKTTKLHPSSDDIDLEAMFHQIHQEYPNLTPHGISRAFGIAHDELIEQDDKREHDRFMFDFGLEMFEGLPKEAMLIEAVRMKAAQGNKLALRYLAETTTKAARITYALSDAAYAAHPQFEQLDNHVIRWTGEGDDGPSTETLIEWFQTNHPKEAHEIERAIKEDAQLTAQEVETLATKLADIAARCSDEDGSPTGDDAAQLANMIENLSLADWNAVMSIAETISNRREA